MRTRSTTLGFTLIELMIAVGIIAGLAAIALPAYRQYVMTSRMAECANEVAAIRLGEEEFFLLTNAYAPGISVAALNAAMGANYTPSLKAAGLDVLPSNCTYSVVVPGAIAGAAYTVTAIGINDLAAMGTVVTFNGP